MTSDESTSNNGDDGDESETPTFEGQYVANSADDPSDEDDEVEVLTGDSKESSDSSGDSNE